MIGARCPCTNATAYVSTSCEVSSNETPRTGEGTLSLGELDNTPKGAVHGITSMCHPVFRAERIVLLLLPLLLTYPPAGSGKV